MKKLYGLNEHDLARLQRSVRFVEDNATMFRTYRRIRGQHGGGGDRRIEGVVQRGLLKADPLRDPEAGPTAGYGQYIVRLASDSTAAWNGETVYAAGDAAIASDDLKYISSTDENVGHDPAGGSEYWQLSSEISPMHFNRRTATDLRPFVPWFEAGERVELVLIDDIYYFRHTLPYVGASTSSIIWVPGDGTPGRMAAVFA
jgi:hypothetical protein